MGEHIRVERVAGVEVEHEGINWFRFFRNPHVLLQILLYGILFYKMAPSRKEVGPLLVCLLLLLPVCVVNVIGTHILTELVARRKKNRNRVL